MDPSETRGPSSGVKTKSRSPLGGITERCGEWRRSRGEEERKKRKIIFHVAMESSMGREPRGPHPRINDFADGGAAETQLRADFDLST